MSGSGHERAVRALTQALIDSDRDGLLALTTADATWTLAGATPWSGTYQVRELLDKTGQLFVDTAGPFTGGVTRIIAAGDEVAVEAWGHVRFADGREYHNEVVLIVRFQGGKIASVKEYGDTDLLVRLFAREATGVNVP